MRNFFRRFLPQREAIRRHRILRPFAAWLQHPGLWHLHRRSVAGGVAVGLFCGLIPGPLQMLSAALLAIALRVNLPLAVVVTTYTNPLTIVPLYFLAFELGRGVLGVSNGMPPPSLPELHWGNLGSELWGWLEALGQPLLVGLPLLAFSFAIGGYLLVRVSWRIAVILRWRARKKRRK